MFGTRPRHTHVYGKRNKRGTPAAAQPSTTRTPPLRLEDDVTRAPLLPNRPVLSKRKQENSLPSSPKLVHVQKHRPISCSSPPRLPLSPFSANRRTSAVKGKTQSYSSTKASRGGLSRLKSSTSAVTVDIVLLDAKGRAVSHEQRTSTPKRSTPERPRESLSSNGTDDSPPLVRHRRRVARRRPLFIESEQSSPEPSHLPTEQRNVPPPANPPIHPAPMRIKKRTGRVKVSIPQSTLNSTLSKPSVAEGSTPSSPDALMPSTPPLEAPRRRPTRNASTPPPLKARPLTPLRGTNRSNTNYPLDLSDSDLDISAIDISDISIDIPSNLEEAKAPSIVQPIYPQFLQPLLDECHQGTTGPCDFSSFIQTFPYDPLVRHYGRDIKFRKIGEASYSEVFGIADIVLKIIPLRDPSSPVSGSYDDCSDPPFESEASDVLKEIIVTRAMTNVCEHFVRLCKAYVVKGRYPQLLLKLWDEFNATKGSESIRPDGFSGSQYYVILVLPNCGIDLEAYRFSHPSRSGWRQACSIFWQVAKTLAHGERLVSFEHRDLHWGQILVNNIAPVSAPLTTQNKNTMPPRHITSSTYMDSPCNGVQVTLIDFGLSRMDAGDGMGGEMAHWSDFDTDILAGEGDYQFDVYRNMNTWNGGNWEAFSPFTNVMWLHYLVRKLIHDKNLKFPAAPRKSHHPGAVKASGRTERECFEALVDIESWLGSCIDSTIPPRRAKSRSRKAHQIAPVSPSPACAGEVVAYAEKRGWIKAF